MKTELTVKEALEQGYTKYVYDSDGFQRLSDILDDEIDFSRNDISLVEKVGYNPAGMDSKEIAELLADHIESNHVSESGDDTNTVYDAIKELDFSEAEMKITETLSSLFYYRSSGIKLIP
ncbi:hypothetical protein MH928_17375 [Flavobacterium sp. WW92]|uniref:hypothetical protein n=1 Tax=unclassified Flavobacterium TaxID=196869 RepID=UPI00222501DE|nr:MULTISPECIES: hypothetical protein [unclassified Flavobacterium]WDO13080.1 hypothetical protein MH928_17375 [Flavobacterium sp. WW92]